MKFCYIHLIRFRVDNARVFQRVCVNLGTTVGQVACRVADYCVRGSHLGISNTFRLQIKKTLLCQNNRKFLFAKSERVKIPEVKH